MRLMTPETYARVVTAPNTVRPIRLRVGPVQIGMTSPEAIDLAAQLVAAVDDLQPPTEETA